MTAHLKNHTQIPQPLKTELNRESLCSAIERSREARMVVLSAPSGYGKTTLLAQIARKHPQESIWLTLTPNESEPVQLHTVLTRALSHAVAGLSFTHSQEALQHTWNPERTAVALARDLDDLELNLRIFLDQAEHLGADALRWLNAFVGALTEGHQVLMSTFDAQSLRIGQWVARGQAVVYGIRELTFSPQECQSLLNVPVPEAQQVHQQFEGWPVCVALVASGAGHYVGPQDLMEDFLQRLPPEMLDWLTEASVLDLWSENEFESVGVLYPFDWEHHLKKAGLPVIPLGQQQYRPHGLLLKALEQHLKKNPERYRLLHVAAARKAEEERRFLEAITHHLTVRYTAEALRITRNIIPNLLGRYEYSLVRRILELFRTSELPDELKYALAQSWTDTGELVRAETLLRDIQQEDLQGKVLLQQAFLANRRGDSRRVISLCNQVLKIEASQRTHTEALRLKAWELAFAGQPEEALTLNQQALQHCESLEDEVLRAHIITHMSSIKNQLEHPIEDIEQGLREAIEVYDLEGKNQMLMISLGNLSDLYMNTGKTAEALQLLEQCVELAEKTDSHYRMVAYENFGDFYNIGTHFTEAETYYQKAARVAQDFKLERDLIRLRYKLCEVRIKNRQPHQQGLEELRKMPSLTTLGAVGKFYEAMLDLAASQPQQALGRLLDADIQKLDRFRRERAKYLKARIERTPMQSSMHLAFQTSDALLFEEAPEAPEPLPEVSRLGVKVVTLGEFALLFEDQKIGIPYKKSAEIMLFLLLHGGCTRDQLVSALYDGDRDPRNIEYFKVLVRRLRNTLSERMALSFNPIIFENNIYRISEKFQFELDFEQLRTPQVDRKWLLDVLKKKKELLPDLDTEWIAQLREDVRQQILNAAVHLARSQDPREGIDVCMDVLRMDEYHDGVVEVINNHLEAINDQVFNTSVLQKVRALRSS